jgi:hypothetical protein
MKNLEAPGTRQLVFVMHEQCFARVATEFLERFDVNFRFEVLTRLQKRAKFLIHTTGKVMGGREQRSVFSSGTSISEVMCMSERSDRIIPVCF